MTHDGDLTSHEIDEILSQAAWSAVSEWPDKVHDVGDLKNELWQWFLESPYIQRTLTKGRATHQAHNILSDWSKQDRKFKAQYDYSIDTVKKVLKGQITGRMAVQDLEEALEVMREKHEPYFDVLIKRYRSEESLSSADKARLRHAHTAVTDAMNAVARARRGGFVPEPGRTLGDGLGQQKPVPVDFGEEQTEPEPRQPYWDRRKPRGKPRPSTKQTKSLKDMQLHDPSYVHTNRY